MTPTTQPTLSHTIGASGFFTLAFGSIVGSGWVIVLGDWMTAAGPGGSALAFLAGGVVMVLVASCYAELACRMPRAGGEFLYALKGLGPPYAFAVSWFITLYFAAFTAFEGIALAWVLEALIPSIRGPVLYSVLGEEISLGALLVGIGGACFFGVINFLGTSTAIHFQRVVTFGFIAVAAGLMLTSVAMGNASNLQPLFASASDRSWLVGAVWIFATTAVFLNGFQAALYAIEERSAATRIHGVVFPMILGVACAVLFYCAIIFAAGAAMPWPTLIKQDLPAAAAFGNLSASGILGSVVLIAAAVSLLKAWNAYVLSGARLIFAQAREGFLPAHFSAIDPRHQTPTRAVLAILVVNVAGVMLGRGAIVPIVNMCAICLACSFVLSLVILLRVRQRTGARPEFQVPGGRVTIYAALVGVGVMAAFAVVEPAIKARGIPLEWMLLAGWSAIGVVSWRYRRRAPQPIGREAA